MTTSAAERTEDAGAGSLDLLDAHVCCLAGRLLLHMPDQPFLERLAKIVLGDAVGDPKRLADGVAALSSELGHGLDRPAHAGHPLVILTRTYELSPFELDLVLVAALPDLDDRFGDLFLTLQPNAGRRRLRLGSALRFLVADETSRSAIRQRLANSTVWEAGMLRGDAAATPLFDRALEPSAALLAGLDGRVPSALDTGATAKLYDPAADPVLRLALRLRPPVREAAAELARWARAAENGLIHLFADPPDAGRLLAEAVGNALGSRLLHVRVPRAEEFAATRTEASLCATLHGALPAFELAPDIDAVALDAEWCPSGIALLLSSTRCAISAPKGHAIRRVSPPVPRPLEQAAVWAHFLDEVGATAIVDVLANQTRLGVEQIARAVRLGAIQARLRGRNAAEHADIARALEEVSPDPGSPLARTRRPRVPWSRLVFDRHTRSRLEDFVRRVQHRVTVQDRWGMAESEGRGEGLVALLHGESGCGKTLAAEAIATQICLPMLSVDLSRVVSKYIGESEKHLAELFALAEGFRALLFFDEADALFGKRTAVTDANSHYANISINFLLQRVEAFDGIAVLATNLLQNVDEAFSRRIQFAIQLPRPTPAAQREIWRQHLPGDRLAADVDLASVVGRFDLVGGEIRNAALSAAYGAAARDTTITQSLIEGAIRQELVKKGRPAPAI